MDQRRKAEVVVSVASGGGVLFSRLVRGSLGQHANPLEISEVRTFVVSAFPFFSGIQNDRQRSRSHVHQSRTLLSSGGNARFSMRLLRRLGLSALILSSSRGRLRTQALQPHGVGAPSATTLSANIGVVVRLCLSSASRSSYPGPLGRSRVALRVCCHQEGRRRLLPLVVVCFRELHFMTGPSVHRRPLSEHRALIVGAALFQDMKVSPGCAAPSSLVCRADRTRAAKGSRVGSSPRAPPRRKTTRRRRGTTRDDEGSQPSVCRSSDKLRRDKAWRASHEKATWTSSHRASTIVASTGYWRVSD